MNKTIILILFTTLIVKSGKSQLSNKQIIPLQYKDSIDFSHDTLTWESAQIVFNIFKNSNVFIWNDNNNCEDRANAMCKVLNCWNINNGKIWLFNKSEYIQKANLSQNQKSGTFKNGWTYHVATFVLIKRGNDIVDTLVIDPAIFSKKKYAGNIIDWAKLIIEKGTGFFLLSSDKFYWHIDGQKYSFTNENWEIHNNIEKTVKGLTGYNSFTWYSSFFKLYSLKKKNKDYLNLLLIKPIFRTYKDTMLISDFYQGKVIVSEQFKKCSHDKKVGNCVTIALIKAAISEFKSIDNIFKEIQYQNNTYYCTLNDGVMLEFTDNERDTVKQLSGIMPSNSSQYYEDAITLYTAICKRVLLENKINCVKSFTNAIEYINSGYNTKKAYNLLGLKKETVEIADIFKYPSVVIWSNYHAAYCTYGKQDAGGKVYEIEKRHSRYLMKNMKGGRNKIKGAYRLIK